MNKTADKIRAALSVPHGQNVPMGASRQFVMLIKAIGESGSNHEEDRVIKKEVKVLESKLREPNVSPRAMKEFLVRLLYCEMLGHETEFGYIHAVKLAQSTSILEKRVGYLAVSLLLHEDHELMLLLVNTLQKDLKSSNVVEVSIALTTIAKVMNAEMIPAVLPMVEEKTSHTREIVRKKAVLAMHRFHSRSPEMVPTLPDVARRALCDSDPGVMAASLNIFYDMTMADPLQFKDLVPSFISILKQIIDKRLPRDFDYHKVPAPWMQIKLLKILSLLGADDRNASESMYEVIRACLSLGEQQGPAAYAVVYECLKTITRIYPSQQLVELAATSIGRFLRAENNNLKYLGITSLVAVTQVNPAYAAEHQMVVIECLGDPDETLKRKTLELLCKMCNPANVVVILDKLLAYLRSSVDPYLRKDLVPRIVKLAERFAPDNQWFLETIISLFENAGDLAPEETFHNVLGLVSNPESGDDAADNELRLFAFETFMDLLERPKLPDCLIRAMCWVIGEYAYLGNDYDQKTVIELVSGLFSRKYENQQETNGWILSAIMKLVAQSGVCPPGVRAIIAGLKAAPDADLADRCLQLEGLALKPAIMQSVLPLDASSEDMDVDPNLGFLNGYVSQALANGAARYKTPAERAPAVAPPPPPVAEETNSGLRFEAYEKPPDVHAGLFAGIAEGRVEDAGPASEVEQLGVIEEAEPTPAPVAVRPEPVSALKAAPKRWGRGGDSKRSAPAPSPDVSAAPKVTEVPEAVPKAATPGVPEGMQLFSIPAEASKAPEAVAPPVRPEPEPEDPEEARKKELASALFATSGTTSSARTRVSRAKKGGTGARHRSGSSTKETGDLLGGDLLGVTGPTAGAASASAVGDLDFFGLEGGLPSGGDAAVSTPAAAPLPMPTGDLLGSLDFSAGSATLAEAPPLFEDGVRNDELISTGGSGGGGNDLLGFRASTAPAGGDLLGSGGDLLGMADAPPPAGGDGLVDLLAMPSAPTVEAVAAGDTLPANLADFDHERLSQNVSSDSVVSITYAKVWKPDELAMVLFISNSGAEAAHVSFQLTRPTALQPRGATSDAFTLSVPGNAQTVQKELHYGISAVSGALSIKGQFSYTVKSMPRTGFFSLSLQAGDFVRPLEIQTEQFGKYWAQPQAAQTERSQRVQQSRYRNSKEFMDGVSAATHLYPVQIIGSEAILAGKVLGGSAHVLVHGKMTVKGIEVLARSTDAGFSQAVIAHAAVDAPGNATLQREISADVATWSRRYMPFDNYTVEGPLAGLGELPVLARMALQTRFRSQLTAPALQSLDDLFLGWLSPRSVAAWVGDPDSWLVVDGSENLDATRKASCYLAALALNRSRPTLALPIDGRTVSEHATAWEAHWRAYFVRRAAEGIGVEMGSPTYAKYALQNFVNIADLSPNIGGLASKFLQLWFADASQTKAFIPSTGVRGGAHNRVYRNAAFFTIAGAIRSVSWLYGWWDSGDATVVNDALSLPQITLFATSPWRPLAVITAAATETSGGAFIYTSRRMGDMAPCSQVLGPVNPQGTVCANRTCTKLPCKPCIVCQGRPSWSECDTLVATGTVLKQEYVGAGRRFTLGAITLDQRDDGGPEYTAGVVQNHQVGAFLGGGNPAASRIVFGDSGSENCSAPWFQRHSYAGITSRLVAGAVAVARPRMAKINGCVPRYCPRAGPACRCRDSDFPLFAFVSADLYATKTDAGDWFCFNGANETFACLAITGPRRLSLAAAPCSFDPRRPRFPASWDGQLLLFNGTSTSHDIGVLQTGTSEDGTFSDFVAAMRSKKISDATDAHGNLNYTTLRGEELTFGVAGVVPYVDQSYTYRSPYIRARHSEGAEGTSVTLGAKGHESVTLTF